MKNIFIISILILVVFSSCTSRVYTDVDKDNKEEIPSNDNKVENQTRECVTEQDCLNSGRCSPGLECTCSKYKCYKGLVAAPDTCTTKEDCKDYCVQPTDPLCFSNPACNNWKCACIDGCA
jgi:hypothetical protein